MARLVPAFVLCVVAMAGCGGTAADQSLAKNPDAEPPRQLAGRYLLLVSQNAGSRGYVEIRAGLLEFPKTPAASPNADDQVRLVETTAAFTGAKLTSSELRGAGSPAAVPAGDRPAPAGPSQGQAALPGVRLVFDVGGQPADFEGVVRGDGAWGSFCVGGGLQCTPARLIPEQESEYAEDELALPAAGSRELTRALSSGADFNRLLEFCRKNPRSPAVSDLYADLVSQLGTLDYTEAQTREFVAEYVNAAGRWGDRLAHIARLRAGNGMVVTEHFPRLGMQYLREVEAGLRPEQVAAVRPILEQGRDILRRVEARELIDRGEHDQAVAMLDELREQRPLDPQVTHLLAVASEKSGATRRALELHGEIAALPQAEMFLVNSPRWQDDAERPGEAVRRLWAGEPQPEELDAFLDRIYVEAVARIAKTVEPPAVRPGSRVVLGELFTGAKCPPCVAADVAGMALEETWPRSNLLILRYHQHSPAEDPLANEHTGRRFAYYAEGRGPMGTPTFVINGRMAESSVGGYFPMAEGVYAALREEIDPLVTREATLSLNVSAREQDGTISLKAAVESEQPLPASLRLRLALAEDDLSFEAANGVRQHRLVVRHMPGEPEGIAPADGRLEFSGTVSIDELRKRLLEELDRFTEATRLQFPVKPMELRPLYLVAFVQDDRTKEVLQAAGVPVE